VNKHLNIVCTSTSDKIRTTGGGGRTGLRISRIALSCALAALLVNGCGGTEYQVVTETSLNIDDTFVPSTSGSEPSAVPEPEAPVSVGFSVGVVQEDFEASDLIESDSGSIFAINNRLDDVKLFELRLIDSELGVEVIDRSATIAPPWSSFEGNEMASVGHGRSGSDHALVISENRVSGQILTATSTDDGATWTTALSENTRCGSHDQRVYIVGGNIGSVSYEACESGTSGLLWQAPLGEGIALTGEQLPVFSYNDEMCSTDEVAVLFDDEYDPNTSSHPYSLWKSADGRSWEEINLPGTFSSPQPYEGWLSCTGDGFTVATKSGGWLFAVDGTFVGEFVAPQDTDRFSMSHGYLFAWSFWGGPLMISDDGGTTWNQVAGLSGDVSDAVASVDGHIWVLAEGTLYSSVSRAGL